MFYDMYRLIAAGYTDGADYYNELATYVNTAIADGFRVMLWTIDARGDYVDGIHRAGHRRGL